MPTFPAPQDDPSARGPQDAQGPFLPAPQPNGPPAPRGYGPPAQQTWGPAPPPGAYTSHGYVVQPKTPILFGLASLLIGGLGTMLAGRVARGVVILCVMLFNGLLMLIPLLGLLFVPVAIGLWIFSGVDGYRTAQTWNRERGILS